MREGKSNKMVNSMYLEYKETQNQSNDEPTTLPWALQLQLSTEN